ncbi:MAG: hypothetical protein ACRD44_16765 [Bryobacteraceae bacterium]
MTFRDRTALFNFGARRPDKLEYAATDGTGHSVSGKRKISFWLDMKEGEETVLAIGYHDFRAFGPAMLVIERVTVHRVGP